MTENEVLREAPTTVPDSYSVGSSLPSGTPAALRPAPAAGAAEILIENARLEFRVNGRKQTLAIKSNRERMAVLFHENRSKQPTRSKPPDDLAPGSIFIFLRVFGAFLFHRTVAEPAHQPIKLLSDASPKAERIIIIPGSCYRTGVVCPYKNAQFAQERNTLPRTARGRKPAQFSPCQRRSL